MVYVLLWFFENKKGGLTKCLRNVVIFWKLKPILTKGWSYVLQGTRQITRHTQQYVLGTRAVARPGAGCNVEGGASSEPSFNTDTEDVRLGSWNWNCPSSTTLGPHGCLPGTSSSNWSEGPGQQALGWDPQLERRRSTIVVTMRLQTWTQSRILGYTAWHCGRM